MLNLHDYDPQLARKTIFHQVRNRHHSSNARGRHPQRGCSIEVGFTRRHVPVSWGVNSTTKSSRYNAQRDTSLSCCRREIVQSAASVRSLCQLDGVSSEALYAFGDKP